MTDQKNAIVRQSFGGSEIQSHKETAALAVAAQAKASIEARWIIAKSQPRNMETVRQELLRECQRPSFAEAAIYLKPIGTGKGIEGLSIRFVEAALQSMGNVDTESSTVYDDDDKRIVAVAVTDFQRNVSHKKQITITKAVERRYLRKGQTPISQRTNSTGETTYLIQASEDDLLNKEGALVSKAVRTCGLRIIPGWLQDECLQIINKTAADAAARDPDEEKRKLLDGFGQIGVTPGDLEAYLGHPLGQMVPAELVQLRNIWKTIQAGETTWVDTLAHRHSMRGADERKEVQEVAKPAKSSSGVQGVKAALAQRGAPPAQPMTPTPKAAPPIENAPVEPQPDAEPASTEPAKRPSKSKSAQAERKAEMEAIGRENIQDGAKANLYVQYGDPRNKEKALAAPSKPTESEVSEAQMESQAKEAAAEAQEQGNVATTPDGTKLDATTGEVLDEEPAWMRDAPPEGEGF